MLLCDFHIHSTYSDGSLELSKAVDLYGQAGFDVIAITDHVDFSNIDFVVKRIVKTCRILNRYWKIKAIPGVEITHVPPQCIKNLVRFARKEKAKIVVGHGETVSEPVLPGTNRACIKAGVDILAHPGMISEEDIRLARLKSVFLEITTRKQHSTKNRRLVRLALKHKAPMVLNTDAHLPEDLLDDDTRNKFLVSLGIPAREIDRIIKNSHNLSR